MNTTRPPLTKAKHGSTRCAGCSKLFTATPDMEVTEVVGEERDGPGRNSVGFVHRHTSHPITRRWHAACLTEWEAWNEESKARAAADREQTIRDMCAAAGLDYDTVKAEHDRRQAEAGQ